MAKRKSVKRKATTAKAKPAVKAAVQPMAKIEEKVLPLKTARRPETAKPAPVAKAVADAIAAVEALSIPRIQPEIPAEAIVAAEAAIEDMAVVASVHQAAIIEQAAEAAAIAVDAIETTQSDIKEGVKTMTETNKKTMDAGRAAFDQFNSVFGDINERAKATVERSAKIVEELADITRGNVEAMVASSKLAAKGVETLTQDVTEYSRKSFEEASTALKRFTEARSATDFVKLQGEFARAAFDNAVAESARVSEKVLKLAGEVAEPITSRYGVAVERAKALAA